MFSILLASSIFTIILCQAEAQAKCANSLCNHEAVCSLEDEKPTCTCVKKFFKGDACSEMIDHCNPNPCRNKGTCHPYLGHYFCACPEGFAGQKCTSAKDTFTGLHLHFNHIAPLGEEQLFLLTVQNLGTVQTAMDFFTADYVIDGGSFSSSTDHFKPHSRLSDLAESLGLRHSNLMPYESGFYRISRGTFWKPGLPEMALHLSDEESSESFFSETFNILIYDPKGRLCLPLIPLPNCENPRQSLHIDMVSFNFIEPIVQQRCLEKSRIAIKWSIRNYVDSVVLHAFPEDSSTMLTIPPYTMWFDFRDDYVQSYLVQGDVSELDASGNVVGRTILRCYVFLDSKSTHAKIVGGPSRKVNVKASFVVDGSTSLDFARRPSSDQQLIYKWSCSSQDASNDHCKPEIGRDSRLFIPANVLNLGSVYNFRLEVQSTINVYSISVASQSIEPVVEDPLLLDFECLRNCQQLKFAAGKPIHLKVVCLDCPRGESVYSIRDAGGVEVSTVHRVILTEITKTEVSLEATASLGERQGTTSVKLKLNKPPTHGKCLISPTSGTEFQTIFTISCLGYEDSLPISFLYKAGNSTLDYGRNKTLTTRLFPTRGRTCEVAVHVCDELGACTEDNLQVPLNLISPTDWLGFLQQNGSHLQKLVAGGDRLSINALIKATIQHLKPGDALNVAEYIVKSLQPFEARRLLVVEQILSMATQLFDAVPLSSKSAVLTSELLGKVASGLEHSIQNHEIVELPLETHEQMLNDLTAAIARASTEIDEFGTVHTAEVMPPEDPVAEDYPDYGKLDVQEVLKLSDWLQAFNGIHKCLQLMGVASAFLLLPDEAPIMVKQKGLITKTLVVDPSERSSLTFSAFNTNVHLPPGFLGDKEIAIQFSVFERNPIWWNPEQYKVKSDVLSLGVYSRDLEREPTRGSFTFTMALKPTDDVYLAKAHVNGALDMPVYERVLPANAVLVVKFLPPYGGIRVLLTTGKRPRSHMLSESRKVGEANFILVNPDTKPTKVYIAVTSDEKIDFAFTMFIRICLTWNPTSSDWTSEHCSVGSETNTTHIHCSCSHLSVFAAKVHPTFGRLQPSRSIRKNLSLNYSLMATHLVVVALILVLLLVAWRRDQATTRGVVALNIKPGLPTPYRYLVTIFTNGHASAGTSSNVTIQLHGDLLDSPEFKLYPAPSRPLFERNAQTAFVIHCRAFLGSLQAVSLRHDSFGRSPSWNCHAVRVRDITEGGEYVFMVDEWLSNAEDASYIVSPTTKEDLNRKGLIFRETLASEFANWYAEEVFHSPRMYGNLSGTEKTAIFAVRLCVVLIGTMIAFGPTTTLTYEEEREIYYYMLLDLGKLFPIAFYCHLTGVGVGLTMAYLFNKLRTGARPRFAE